MGSPSENAGRAFSGPSQRAARGAASNVASAAEQAWESTSHGAQRAASAVAHTAEDVWGSMRTCMSRYPFAVFFTGLAVGALVVMALDRRKL